MMDNTVSVETPAQRKRGDAPGMARRSYYLTSDIADRFAAAVDELQIDTRNLLPRHVLIGAIIQRGLAQVEEIRAELIDTVHELVDPPTKPNSSEAASAVVAAILQHMPGDIDRIRALLNDQTTTT